MSRHLVMCKYMPHSDEIFSLRIALIQGTHTLYNFVYNSMPMKAKDISPSYDDNFFRHDADIPSSAVGAKVKKKNFKLNSLSLEMMSFLFLLDRLNGFSLVLLLSEGFISTFEALYAVCQTDSIHSYTLPIGDRRNTTVRSTKCLTFFLDLGIFSCQKQSPIAIARAIKGIGLHQIHRQYSILSASIDRIWSYLPSPRRFG